jgi:hypothetical protein
MPAIPSHLHEPGPLQLNERTAARATKVTLISVFVGVMAAFIGRLARRDETLTLNPFELLMLGLSSFRIGRMIAFEGVAEPLREPFTDTLPDASGAGQTVVASGYGVRRVFGELLSCPICIGTWAAAGLVYGLQVLPRPTRVLLAVMSSTGIGELCYSVTEWLDWTARAARRRCRD